MRVGIQQQRRNELERLANEQFDVLIIGGGINGAGIARDLAMRGVKTALIDKSDIAAGTSSASTKLIHGGLRYLEQFHFGLVRESCRERALLLELAPHLVRPLPFMIPVYKGDPRPLTIIRAGLTLYDLLAGFQNVQNHHILSKKAALKRCDHLQPEGLKGAALYYDCKMDDARLCLEVALSARDEGALIVNHLAAVDFIHHDGRLAAVEVEDEETGERFPVAATKVINATGPWLDKLRTLDGDDTPLLRPTRGSHIIVPRIGSHREALYLTSASDNRLFFAIPWGDYSLIGTTDVDDSSNPEQVTATQDDIDYLLTEAKRHLHDVAIEADQVVSSFSGLRALIADHAGRESSVSREHSILISDSGLISVGGGKYTTYRAVAEEVADMVIGQLGGDYDHCKTAITPLPGAFPIDDEIAVAEAVDELTSRINISDVDCRRMINIYGAATKDLLAARVEGVDPFAPVVDGSTLLGCQAVYAVEQELARTPEDILRRRTSLALSAGRGMAELKAVAEIVATMTGASAEKKQSWIDSYRKRYS